MSWISYIFPIWIGFALHLKNQDINKPDLLHPENRHPELEVVLEQSPASNKAHFQGIPKLNGSDFTWFCATVEFTSIALDSANQTKCFGYKYCDIPLACMHICICYTLSIKEKAIYGSGKNYYMHLFFLMQMCNCVYVCMCVCAALFAIGLTCMRYIPFYNETQCIHNTHYTLHTYTNLISVCRSWILHLRDVIESICAIVWCSM